MAIPDSPNWSSLTDIGEYPEVKFGKPAIPTGTPVNDINVGPVELNDSQGTINNRYWLCDYKDGSIYIRGAVSDTEWGDPVKLIDEPIKPLQLSLSFDQLGRPMVFYRINESDLKLYWYNPVDGVNEIKDIGQGKDPFIGMDAPQDTGAAYSDNMLFYVRDDAIWMRIQRDRFEIEYATPVVDTQDIDLKSTGLRVDNRYQVVYRKTLREDAQPFVEPIESLEMTTEAVYSTSPVAKDPVKTSIMEQGDFLFSGGSNSLISDMNRASFTVTLDIENSEFGEGRIARSFPIICDGMAKDLKGTNKSLTYLGEYKPISHPLGVQYYGSSTKYGNNPDVPLDTVNVRIESRLCLEVHRGDMNDLTDNKYYVVLVLNGEVNVIPLDFEFKDGLWEFQLTRNNDLIIRHYGQVLGSYEVRRGISRRDEYPSNTTALLTNLITGNDGNPQYSGRNFKGVVKSISLNLERDGIQDLWNIKGTEYPNLPQEFNYAYPINSENGNVQLYWQCHKKSGWRKRTKIRPV